MIIEDQAEVVRFLSSPATFAGDPVEQIETHSAIVFLAGARAYKLKRAVRFDYLDFSTVERRKQFCEAELRLNRRTAPTLYRDVVPVCRRPSGVLGLGGEGTIVDWLVEMNRFDQANLFDRLAATGGLQLDVMSALAAAIADFHRAADVRMSHGGREGMAWVVDGNVAGFAEFGQHGLDPALAGHVTDRSLHELQRTGSLLDERRRSGSVRQCHGDLHLRNIVLLDGRPTLFDGVEFNDDISCIDIGYDMAFLLMDLWRKRLLRHANVVLNRYLAETGDLDILSLLPLFLSCRAAVRAKTSATAARMQEDGARRKELQVTAGEYLDMAGQFLERPPSALVAVGGLSGTGKSTLALALAHSVGAAPGAMVFRSDEIRKRLIGVAPLKPLGPDGYSPEMNRRVYDRLLDAARTTLRTGHAAIVDAVYAEPEQREAMAQVAADAGVPFIGLWLDAPAATLVARVEGRRHDASDADARVVRLQQARDLGSMTWHLLDASSPAATVLAVANRLLRDDAPEVLSTV